MPFFVLNRKPQPEGEYEVHDLSANCIYLPAKPNMIHLGPHESCHGAVSEARLRFLDKRINGCFYCCNECNKG